MRRSWQKDTFLPSTTALRLLSVSRTDDGVLVEAQGQPSARCPSCRRRSRARHSRYSRTLKDLAAQGESVTLRVHVSRWRCQNPRCDMQVFTERLAGVCAPHARHTGRFAVASASSRQMRQGDRQSRADRQRHNGQQRRADPIRARSARLATDCRGPAQSTACAPERSPNRDGGGAEAAVSGLHADAAPGLELSRHLAARQGRDPAPMDDSGGRLEYSCTPTICLEAPPGSRRGRRGRHRTME
jgi:zinc-finger of transposase IS204/IS1001/IS1096/IS1165